MKRAKLGIDEHGLIVSILPDKNDLNLNTFRTLITLNLYTLMIWMKNFDFNQDEHYSKIKEKFNDTEESMTIHQN